MKKIDESTTEVVKGYLSNRKTDLDPHKATRKGKTPWYMQSMEELHESVVSSLVAKKKIIIEGMFPGLIFGHLPVELKDKIGSLYPEKPGETRPKIPAKWRRWELLPPEILSQVEQYYDAEIKPRLPKKSAEPERNLLKIHSRAQQRFKDVPGISGRPRPTADPASKKDAGLFMDPPPKGTKADPRVEKHMAPKQPDELDVVAKDIVDTSMASKKAERLKKQDAARRAARTGTPVEPEHSGPDRDMTKADTQHVKQKSKEIETATRSGEIRASIEKLMKRYEKLKDNPEAQAKDPSWPKIKQFVEKVRQKHEKPGVDPAAAYTVEKSKAWVNYRFGDLSPELQERVKKALELSSFEGKTPFKLSSQTSLGDIFNRYKQRKTGKFEPVTITPTGAGRGSDPEFQQVGDLMGDIKTYFSSGEGKDKLPLAKEKKIEKTTQLQPYSARPKARAGSGFGSGKTPASATHIPSRERQEEFSGMVPEKDLDTEFQKHFPDDHKEMQKTGTTAYGTYKLALKKLATELLGDPQVKGMVIDRLSDKLGLDPDEIESVMRGDTEGVDPDDVKAVHNAMKVLLSPTAPKAERSALKPDMASRIADTRKEPFYGSPEFKSAARDLVGRAKSAEGHPFGVKHTSKQLVKTPEMVGIVSKLIHKFFGQEVQGREIDNFLSDLKREQPAQFTNLMRHASDLLFKSSESAFYREFADRLRSEKKARGRGLSKMDKRVEALADEFMRKDGLSQEEAEAKAHAIMSKKVARELESPEKISPSKDSETAKSLMGLKDKLTDLGSQKSFRKKPMSLEKFLKGLEGGSLEQPEEEEVDWIDSERLRSLQPERTPEETISKAERLTGLSDEEQGMDLADKYKTAKQKLKSFGKEKAVKMAADKKSAARKPKKTVMSDKDVPELKKQKVKQMAEKSKEKPEVKKGVAQYKKQKKEEQPQAQNEAKMSIQELLMGPDGKEVDCVPSKEDGWENAKLANKKKFEPKFKLESVFNRKK